MTALRLEAPAKLNLSLRVVGRRPDGYHLLETEIVLLELADRLVLMPGSSGLRIQGNTAAGLPVDDSNLAWRGLIAGLGGRPERVRLTLEKVVPAESGLGGGSSDAAAAWRLGRAYRGIGDAATPSDLAGLTSIGADVPFFAAALPAARVSGIGQLIEPLPAPERHIVLVHPPFGLSTAAVFGELRDDEWGRLENDLFAPARRLKPELDAILSTVRDAGGTPRLSGSGSTIFSLHDGGDEADEVAARLARAGQRVTITRTRRVAAEIEQVNQEN